MGAISATTRSAKKGDGLLVAVVTAKRYVAHAILIWSLAIPVHLAFADVLSIAAAVERNYARHGTDSSMP